LEDILKGSKPPFGTFIDIRTTIPLQSEVKKIFQECEQITKEAGLQRRAVIYNSPIVKGQATQISHMSQTDNIERYINAFVTKDWEKVALDWIVNGIEPSFSTKDSIPLNQPN